MRGNSGKRWSGDEIVMLRRLLTEGVRSAEIADVLGRTPDAIQHMRSRIKHEHARELRCPRCDQLRPVAQFRPSQRHSGGYCSSCVRSYERRTEQAEALAIGG